MILITRNRSDMEWGLIRRWTRKGHRAFNPYFDEFHKCHFDIFWINISQGPPKKHQLKGFDDSRHLSIQHEKDLTKKMIQFK